MADSNNMGVVATTASDSTFQPVSRQRRHETDAAPQSERTPDESTRAQRLASIRAEPDREPELDEDSARLAVDSIRRNPDAALRIASDDLNAESAHRLLDSSATALHASDNQQSGAQNTAVAAQATATTPDA